MRLYRQTINKSCGKAGADKGKVMGSDPVRPATQPTPVAMTNIGHEGMSTVRQSSTRT